MFEDLEEEGVDVSPDASDRAIVYAIWSRGDTATLTPEEAWAILHERYPDDARFLLLNAYAEIAEHAGSGAWTAGYFLKKVERILERADEPLTAKVRDLVAFGGALLGPTKGDDATTLAAVRDKLGLDAATAGKRDERAGLRLRRYERELLRELHDRTADDKPLGVRAASLPPPASPAAVWAGAVADPAKPRKKYGPALRFEHGELVEHPKFGIGVVTATEPGRVSILFETGTRKLVSA